MTSLSLREPAAVLEVFGVSRSYQAIWQWVHRSADSVPDPRTFTRAVLSCSQSEAEGF